MINITDLTLAMLAATITILTITTPTLKTIIKDITEIIIITITIIAITVIAIIETSTITEITTIMDTILDSGITIIMDMKDLITTADIVINPTVIKMMYFLCNHLHKISLQKTR
jgi:hypothetical protein